MKDTPPSSFNVTAGQIRPLLSREAWESLSLEQLSSLFARQVTANGRERDSTEGRVFRLLRVVVSFLPNFEATGNPFGCWFRNVPKEGTRSYMAEDLHDEDLDALEGIISDLTNPAFQARVADVVWECRKKNHHSGQAAVRAYLANADREARSEGRGGTQGLASLERAAQLARKMNRKGELYAEVLSHIKQRLVALPVAASSAKACQGLMGILIRHQATELPVHAALMEKFARLLEDEGESEECGVFWDLAMQIYQAAKCPEEAAHCELKAALMAEASADKLLPSGSPDLHQVNAMKQALVRLRKAKAPAEKIHEVHQRLLAMQKDLSEQFHPMEFSENEIPGAEDLKKLGEQCYVSVSGMTFQEAVAYLATHVRPTDSKALKAEVQKIMSENPLLGIFDTVQMDHSGKTSETIEGNPFGLSEEALKQHMLIFSREIEWRITVACQIEPARQAIAERHTIRFHDLAFLVTNNSFVQEGREELYLRGIQAGFYGDWALASHFLIPQLEESVRHIIRLKKGITSTLKNGVQRDIDLNELLWMPQAEEAFGKDMVYDLRGILIEKCGYNLRNDMAHGLLSADSFYNIPSIYLWWLVIKLCWHGHWISQRLPEALQNP